MIRAAAAAPERDSTAPSVPLPPADTAHAARYALWGAAGVFAVWLLCLTALVLTTANPTQLNWVQLSLSRVLVTAEVQDPATGSCRLLRQFTPQKLPQTLQVSNLQEAGARAGSVYLLPLIPDVTGPADSFRIVSVPEREIGPLIYPADARLEAELTAWQAGRR